MVEVSVRGPSKYVYNWNPISRRYFSRVKEQFSNSLNILQLKTSQFKQLASQSQPILRKQISPEERGRRLFGQSLENKACSRGGGQRLKSWHSFS